MDEFFKKMREIQKKERANSSLARVGEDFYQRIHNYIAGLNDLVGNDPFANEHYLLKDTQRIATEICERREHKIADYAVMNIHRSYHLFKGKPTFDLKDTTPLNLTPEEEALYFSLIDVLKNHKVNISLERIKGDVISDKDNVADNVPNNKGNIIEDTNKITNDINNANGMNHESKTIATTKFSTNVNEIINDINSIEDSNNIYSSKSHNTDNILNNNVNINNNTDTTSSNNNKVEPNSIENIDEEFPDITNIEKNDFEDIDNLIFKENNSDGDNNIDSSKTSSSGSNNIINNNTIRPSPSKSLFSKDELLTSTLLVFDEVPAIVCSNEKVYGPLNPQDIVTIPKINADIIVKSKKGRFVKS